MRTPRSHERYASRACETRRKKSDIGQKSGGSNGVPPTQRKKCFRPSLILHCRERLPNTAPVSVPGNTPDGLWAPSSLLDAPSSVSAAPTSHRFITERLGTAVSLIKQEHRPVQTRAGFMGCVHFAGRGSESTENSPSREDQGLQTPLVTHTRTHFCNREDALLSQVRMCHKTTNSNTRTHARTHTHTESLQYARSQCLALARFTNNTSNSNTGTEALICATNAAQRGLQILRAPPGALCKHLISAEN